ncbi:MAG: ribulose-phosphate 3-epimerase [Bdellovibrionales bacterium]|nr:ribulose-phosphate 3-epimerase [Bdellovibrionales bacterium]
MSKTNEKSSIPVVAASVLAADLAFLAHEVQDVVNGGAQWLHIDVMDGQFVPPITFGANIVAAIGKAVDIPLDVHLMIEQPENHIEAFAKAGANLITVHQEVSPHLHRTLSAIKDFGIQCGVAINPSTPAESIYPVLDLVDLVLVMTVNPGWGGQPFLPRCVSKIESLSQKRDEAGLGFYIEVDGGIQPDSASLCRAAGADVFVAGSYIFKAKDRKSAIGLLQDSISSDNMTSRIN